MQRLTLIEEKFVMQKSRIRWLTVGDQNTTFYHNVVLERSARNIIQILHTADGVPLLATEDIKHEAVNYFQKFLQADPTSSATSSYDELRDLLRFRYSQEDVTMLISPITPVEITILYSVWKERNSRRHGGVWVTTEKITRTIDKQIRNWISYLRYVKNHPLEGLMRRWFEVS
ncbi:hypothetical protein DY000_02049442 [Brassica cretica]|uniref:Uncharacterized protein n=1 Tax=Brassica cretica TaxID=69181 RepID=A0ABQ7EVP2_BRACR|nr:hypothetical protein DY000_02049442 [Brassica cretica]